MIRIPYIVEMSTPDDDVLTVPVPDLGIAKGLYESISVSDDKIPRVSIYFRDDDCCLHEIFRKETDAWKRSVAIARAEINAFRSSCTL